eukprot:TRINITY_DN2981_c0_g1_i3.p1 TRINITY_DN2981_c0_g1~~TRINITY_DN2981_c0_g1_i3.p1  ORF type:complete len:396 (+),score=69.45 TRINITY_DN2981_c0_g1_i3:162-1349(+)
MSHFFELRDRLDGMSKEFFSKMQDASDNLAIEKKSAIRIQSYVRGCKERQNFRAKFKARKTLRSRMLGCLGLKRVRAMRLERTRRMNMLFFHHCACVIQRFFRGWWSRRHLHNYYGRKAYLATVEKRGEWTRQRLQLEQTIKVNQAKEREEHNVRKAFDDLAGELHHLVSTKTIAGVYNPPYSDALPRAFDKPIEQHLRDSMQVRLPKSLRRPRRQRTMAATASPHPGGRLGMSQNERIAFDGNPMGAAPPQEMPERIPHAARSASVGRMQKIQGPFRSKEQIEVANAKASNVHRTVQQSSTYDAVDQDRKMQQKLSKLSRVSPVDFMAPGLPTVHPMPSSVHIGVPFRERPTEVRGDYVELPKIRDKPPFFTAVSRDRHFDEYQDNHLLPSGAV